MDNAEDLFVIPNAEERPCRSCGAVHQFLSNTADGRPCGTPALFTRSFLEQTDGVARFMGAQPVQPAIFRGRLTAEDLMAHSYPLRRLEPWLVAHGHELTDEQIAAIANRQGLTAEAVERLRTNRRRAA